jgi:glyoxylase-like metal-dependent hydrolase (beta-lactamase superfamily II)
MNAPLPSVLDYPHAAPPAPGEVVAVAPRVLWLRMPLPFALDHINLWLLADRDDGFTLVDCGIGDAATRALWERHAATTLAARPIRRIIATHCHPDHVGNAGWLAARFAAPVAMTHAEFLTAHAMRDEHSGYSIAATVDLFRRHGMAAEQLAALLERGNGYRRLVPELPEGFDRLLDGDVERGVLIAGDMLLPRISTNVSVWAVERDGDPLTRFLDSLTAFEALPADTLVLPSHGLPFRGIPLRVAQLRAHHVARLDELDDAVSASDAPQSAAELVPVLFRRELDLQQRYFAMGEAIAHLNFLWHAARLQRRVAADGTIRFAA